MSEESDQNTAESERLAPVPFLSRMYAFVRYPTRTWAQIVEERESKGKEYVRYYLPAYLLWVSGSIFGFLVFGVYYPVQDSVTQELSVSRIYPDESMLVVHQLFFSFFYLVLPFVLAKMLYVLTKLFSREEERNGEKIGTIADARRLLIYSQAPVLAAATVQAVPGVSIFYLVVLVMGYVIYFKGISPMLGIAQGSRGLFFIGSMLLFIAYYTVVFLFSVDIVGNPYEAAIREALQTP